MELYPFDIVAAGLEPQPPIASHSETAAAGGADIESAPDSPGRAPIEQLRFGQWTLRLPKWLCAFLGAADAGQRSDPP
jgi:hypothetical protein